MNAQINNSSDLGIIRTIIAKDVVLYFRNRFFAFITVLSMVAYIAIYYLMPGTVTERFDIGIFPADVPDAILEAFTSREMAVTPFESEAALIAAVEAGDQRAGLVLPPDTLTRLAAAEPTEITAYYPPGIPQDLNDLFTDFLTLAFNELGYQVNAEPMLIERNEEVLGPDLSNEPIAPRDRLLPLFALLIFMMETLGLATLISEEIERGTLRALLITPMNIGHLFVGKGVTGVGLAFVQATFLLLITGSLGIQPLIILTALLLGALLVTGLGFLIASVARDIMS
ncbi:MAG: ABC transporter permease, partial [Chloroflexi bacterium]|nr:ABC transporter permease [Chloroflexota bacterium]